MDHLLSQITVREVDRYKTAKLAEGVLSANTLNKTLARLSSILALAVEWAQWALMGTGEPLMGTGEPLTAGVPKSEEVATYSESAR